MPASSPFISGPARLLRRTLGYVPITPLGLLVATLAGLLLYYVAFDALDLVLLIFGYGALGLVAMAIVTVLVAALRVVAGLHIGRRRADRRAALPQGTVSAKPSLVETGRATATGYWLPAMWWLPVARLSCRWYEVGAEDGTFHPAEDVTVELERRLARFREVVVFASRAEVRVVRRRIVIGDAFGLSRLVLWPTAELRMDVLPAVGGLSKIPVLTSLAGGDEQSHPRGLSDGDRVELRRYVPGDPARLIHWKVYGRTRQLMVRMPERALSQSRRTAAFLVAGPDDEPSAALARVAIESGALGDEWTFATDVSGVDAETVEAAHRQIIRSKGAGRQAGRGLRAYVERTERKGPTSFVVFAPPRPGPWLDALATITRGRQRGCRVVIGIDALAPRSRSAPLARLFTRDRPVAGVPPEELEALLQSLQKAGVEVSLFDRPTGKRLGAAHRAALRRPAHAIGLAARIVAAVRRGRTRAVTDAGAAGNAGRPG